jgi:hypothetical protein
MSPNRWVLVVTLALAAAACGRAPEFPDDSILVIEAPDDEAAAPLCAEGDDAYRGEGRLKRIVTELNEAVEEHLPLLRAARRAALVATRRNGGFERRFEGPRGTATYTATELPDGSVTWTVTVGATGQQEFTLAEGTLASDGLGGEWRIHNRGGRLVRTITWTRPALGSPDLSATWKNETNGRVAAYSRVGTSATLAVTGPLGVVDFAWDTATGAGRVVATNPAGEAVQARCWDDAQCDVECPGS